MSLFSAIVLTFALGSVLWFSLGFAITAQLIADGSMRDELHLAFGYLDAAVEASTVVGWLWALFKSARVNSVVNHPVQIMCSVTAATQVTALLVMAMLLGGWSWTEPTGLLLGYGAVAALFALQIGRSRRRTATSRK